MLLIGFLAVGLVLRSAYAAVTVYPVPTGAPGSSDFTVTVDGQPVGLYGAYTRYTSSGDTFVDMTDANTTTHLVATFGNFDFSGGPVTVVVKANFAVTSSTSWTILPARLGIPFTKSTDGSTITFTLSQPAKLSFLVGGNYQGRTLHLFGDAPEVNPPSASDPNVIYYGPGFYSPSKAINLSSNQTLYLAGGAVLKGVVNISGVSNVKICGRGLLMQTTSTPGQIGVYIKNSTGVSLEGIMENGNNPTRWCTLIYLSKNVTVKNWKVVSPWIWSTDGCNISSSTNVVYDDCFIRSGDDCIAIKGLGTNYSFSVPNLDPQTSSYGRNSQIAIRNVQLWSDNNNGVVLGEETLCNGYDNVSFANSDILYVHDNEATKGAMAFTALNGTSIEDVVFDDVRVGNCGQLIAMLYSELLYSYETGSQAWPGWMKRTQFSNIFTNGTSNRKINIKGWTANNNAGYKNYIDGVALDNISMNGALLTPFNSSGYFLTNSTAANVTFSAPVVSAPVATPQILNTNKNTALPITLAGATTGSIASYAYDQPEHGTVTGTGRNVTYTPTSNYVGSDCFAFSVTDANGKVGVRVPVVITVLGTATTLNQPPSVTSLIATVSGTTVTLSALGADDAGEAALTYWWDTNGGAPVIPTFTANGTNAAKSSSFTLTKAGVYPIRVTVRDAGNLTALTTVTVTVDPTLTTLTVSPTSASVVFGLTQTFTVTANDQFNTALSVTPSWSVTGGGTISSGGVFTAGNTVGGPWTVTATTGGLSATAAVSVISNTPILAVGSAVTTADATNANTVTLTWNNVNATSYSVLRATTSGGPYTALASGLTTFTYTDPGLGAGPYYYVVQGTTSGTNGPLSNEIRFGAPVSPWANQDLGAPTLFGGTLLNNGTFTVTAAGSDLWGSTDQGQFVYQTWTGDGMITARVVDLTNTNASAKAGVMFRESLAAGARNAFTEVTPTNGAQFQVRLTTNSTTTTPAILTGRAAPQWVRLVRKSGVYISSVSADGLTWTQLATPTSVTMTASPVYVGLAVTSHNTGARATAHFDNVTVIGPPAPPTQLAATAGSIQVTLSWTPSSSADTFSVKRATVSGGPYTTLASGLTANTYVDTMVTPGSTYYYVVTETNALTESSNSTEAFASLYTAQEAWRLSYFGTVANSGIAADTADPDGDGMTNLQEFQAGTDPVNSASVFRVSQIATQGTDYVIGFSTIAGHVYTVERSTDLSSNGWTTVADNLSATGSSLQWTDVGAFTAYTRVFYRVRLKQ